MPCFTAAENGTTFGGAFAMRRASIPASRPCCVRPSPRLARPRRPLPPPGLNRSRDKLRKELEAALSLPHGRIPKDHGAGRRAQERRGWVWAQLGESPYAIALEPLGKLARQPKEPLGGTTAETMAANYAAQGWQCDRAAIDA